MYRQLHRQAAISLVALLVPFAIGLQPEEARGATAPDNEVKVWSVNMGNLKMAQGDNWKKVITSSMATHGYKPDVVAVQGIAQDDKNGDGKQDAEQFRDQLEATFSTSYAYRHAHGNTNENYFHNTMILWRTARFVLADATDVIRWRELMFKKDDNLPGGGLCEVRLPDPDERNEPSKFQIAVKLQDIKDPSSGNDRNLVAASVHFDTNSADECNHENAVRMHNQFDNLASIRQMTVVGGDFNDHPQKTGGADCDTAGVCESGRQPDPKCWYRSLQGVFYPSTGCPLDYDVRTYYDAVFVDAKKDGDLSDLCLQWTRSKDEDPGDAANACTNILSPEGGLRDKSRIDYVWARFESDSGAVQRLSEAAAFDQFGKAGADQLAPDPDVESLRYSDHRAVHAIVRWLD